MPDQIEIRPARPDDRPAILELAGEALGWGDDERTPRLFSWKHDENPFGPSPAWVAAAGGRLAGFRTFLRWEFDGPSGAVHRAVRAVDTATHPDFQGRGIFTKLTLGALDSLTAEGVSFVFNTPNAQSRPGYVKMGWTIVGRLPVRIRPRSPLAAARMVLSRVPAEKWSVATDIADAASDVLTDSALAGLLGSQPAPGALRTRRSPAYLRWRYGFEPLHYRAVAAPGGVEEGVAVFRLRRRGRAVEAAVVELLAVEGRRTVEQRLVSRVARLTGADYLIRLVSAAERPRGQGGRRLPTDLPLPRQGPILTGRTLTAPVPPLAGWDLRLGDIELF